MRIFLIVVVLAILVGIGLRWEAVRFEAPGPAAAEVTIIVKPGTGLRGVARLLADNGAVSSATMFRLGVMRRGASTALKAGEYVIAPQASESEILEMMIQGRVVTHKLTVAEGLTSGMIVALVNADPVLEGDPASEPPEGSLLPETYLYERGTTRKELIARMMKAQADVIAELWPKRQEGLPFASPQEALIMASIVEKETGIPSERGVIARVFLNRLAVHMRLESDPTIIYGLTKGIALGHGLRQSELAKVNPYSTYQIDGLPPTPICNPGRDAIAAVLNPPPSDALFFVADGSGGHVFAATLAEHNANVAKWRQVERLRSSVQ